MTTITSLNPAPKPFLTIYPTTIELFNSESFAAYSKSIIFG